MPRFEDAAPICCAEVPGDTVQLRCDTGKGTDTAPRLFLDALHATRNWRITVVLTDETASQLMQQLADLLEAKQRLEE